uniref:Retinoblastoma-associated protein A-box domain-containing protein n=1 Tax=Octopus bimaculoides TaxID=37653 RepID=A0A0L8H0F6_OCTBM
MEDNWRFLRDNLLKATDQICGWCKVPSRPRVTWWWNKEVDRAIRQKKQAWKDWKNGGSRELYQCARREARRQVYLARGEADKKRFANVLRREDQRLEGEPLHWLACAAYVACRRSVVPTVGQGTMEGNCVSLTRLLSTADFSKMKKWLNMASLPQDFRDKIERLERNFSVSTVTFKKYRPIFYDVFNSASVQPRYNRSRKQRKLPCSVTELFSFCWTMFVQVKGHFPAISDDLVNSYHLLLCCIDWCYANALIAGRKDILNHSFAGCSVDRINWNPRHRLPENFHNKDWKPPSEAPCIIKLLCEKHNGLVVDAKTIKEHHWKPYLKELFRKLPLKQMFREPILRGNESNLAGVLDTGNFEANFKAINRAYGEYVLRVGDFDETIFLENYATEEIGTPRNQSDFSDGIPMDRSIHQHLDETRSLAPPTPLTGRRYLKEKDPNITPISTATQSVSRLQALLSGRKTSPSDGLIAIFELQSDLAEFLQLDALPNANHSESVVGAFTCHRHEGQSGGTGNGHTRNGVFYVPPAQEPVQRYWQRTRSNVFSHATGTSAGKATLPSDHPGAHSDFARNRLQLAESLYFKTLESIAVDEKKRFSVKDGNKDLTVVLEHDIFQRSLFACCLEIVIFSYNSQRTFPWIAEIFELSPCHFYRVIEMVIRAEEGLSRDVVKHLNLIEESILESYAWKSTSPLWDAIREQESIPTCEEVSLPSQLETMTASPPLHPGIRRLVDEGKSTYYQQSPSTSISGRFGSPNPGTARRKLFSTETSSTAQVTNVLTENVSSGTEAQQITVGATGTNTDLTNASVNAIVASNNENAAPSSQTRIITLQHGQQVVIVQPIVSNTTSVSVPSNTVVTPSQQQPQQPQQQQQLQQPQKQKPTAKPKRTGSLALFFRKVYHLAGVRLRDLCEKLKVNEEELQRKMWTCLEHCLVNEISLMKDRHLDQIIMCSMYVIAKVATDPPQTFQNIMRCYRLQPQAQSHVYRNVLLSTRRRRTSGSSDSSRNGTSGSSSPVTTEREDSKEKDKRRTEALSIRSSSTLPVPHPNSQPPTPTKLIGMGSTLEMGEERGDLIQFYNQVFVKRIKEFALKFSANQSNDKPHLSPLPVARSHTSSPRRVSNKHNVYISPHKTNPGGTPHSGKVYCFSMSPAKDLHAINEMIKRVPGKRCLEIEDDICPSPAKRPELMRRLQDVNKDRQKEQNGTA